MGDVGSNKKEREFPPGSPREQRGSSTNSGTTESRSGSTTSWRLRHWRGKSHKLAKKEARPFRRDHLWGTASRNGTRVPPNARILWGMVEFAAYLINRCDIGSDGKDTAAEAAWAEWTTHCTCLLIRQEEEFCTCRALQARGVKVGTAELSMQRQWLSPSRSWRSRHAQRTPGEFRSRRDGTRTEYSECEPFHGLRMAVTLHPIFKSEWRGPRTERVRRPPWRSADGEESSEDLPSQSRLRTVGSQCRLSSVRVPENWSGATASSQRRMSENN